MADESFSEDDAVRDVLRGAGVVYLGLVLEMALAFVAQRFAAVHLSIGGFGNLVSGTAVLDVGAVVAGLGFSAGLARYLPRIDDEYRRPLAKYALLASVPTALLVAVPTVLYAEAIARGVFGEPGLTASLRIFGAAIPFASLLNFSVGGIRGQKVSRFHVYVKNILQPGARFGLVAVAVVVGAGQVGFASAYAVPYLVAAGVGITLFWRALPARSDPQGARRFFPEMVRYSLPFTVSGLASFVYRSVDIFLLLYLVGNRAVGIYGVAYAFARIIALFSTAFNYLSTPVSSQLEGDDRTLEAVDVQATVARWITITTVGALVPMVVFASDFLRLIYRPAYASAGETLAVLAFGFALKNVLVTHGPILQAMGRSKLSAINTATAAGVNLIANLTLIPRYGAFGAAIATALSFLVLGGLPTLEVKYLLGETTLSRRVLAPFLLGVPVTVVAVPVMRQVPKTLLWIVGTSGLFALTYAASVVVVLGFTPAEVMVVRSAEDRFGISLGLVDAVLRRFS